MIAKVDVYGRMGTDPCFNDPYVHAFLMAPLEDWVKSNDLDGLMWGRRGTQERCIDWAANLSKWGYKAARFLEKELLRVQLQ